jgi:hypothetical protein
MLVVFGVLVLYLARAGVSASHHHDTDESPGHQACAEPFSTSRGADPEAPSGPREGPHDCAVCEVISLGKNSWSEFARQPLAIDVIPRCACPRADGRDVARARPLRLYGARDPPA